MNQIEKYFLPYQYAWILDSAHLRIFEKARQTGLTHTDAYDSVIKATTKNHPLDVWAKRDVPSPRHFGSRVLDQTPHLLNCSRRIRTKSYQSPWRKRRFSGGICQGEVGGGIAGNILSHILPLRYQSSGTFEVMAMKPSKYGHENAPPGQLEQGEIHFPTKQPSATQDIRRV